ncbi:MAG TPA: amidohydrolase family protein [Steroidobacteraceae bacterium]|nr:amidohydrolase family protein [Steroidobacteraceae bacterium]
MQHIDTLIAARWIIPIEPAEHILEHHAIAIHQGQILAVGPATELEERFSPTERVDRSHHVLLPGLVNADAQTSRSLLPAGTGEDLWTDADFVRDSVELSIARMLMAGVTCFADGSLFPEIVAEAASSASMRTCIGLPVHDRPNAWADSANTALTKGLELHDEYRSDPLITTHFAPTSELCDETLARVRRAADELELPVAFRFTDSGHGETAGARLERLGLLSALLIAVNPQDLNRTELERLARVGANVVCCSGLERLIHDFRTHGLNVAAGAGNAFRQDVLEMSRAPRCSMRVASVPALEWLRIITLNGAHALGLDDVTGSLVPGKWADICCIDLSDVYAQPMYDVATHVTDYAHRDQVSDVWIAGRRLVRDRQLARIDLPDVLSRVERWRARISGTNPHD